MHIYIYIYISRHALASTPPTQLTATYFACTATVFDAIFNSIGISIGNVQFFVPLFMLFVMPLVYFYLLGVGHVPPKREYEKEEYEASLQAFANIMLRLRDGKSRNLVKNGVLDNLVKELKKAATVQGGYPDSDDDSDAGGDSDDESESDDGSEIVLANPNQKFGLHNVFKRSSIDATQRRIPSSIDEKGNKPRRRGLLGSFVNTKKTSLVKDNKNSSSSDAQQIDDKKDVEMGKRKSSAKRNSAFILKQEKETKRVSMQMKKLAVTIVNAPVEVFSRKNKRRKAITAASVEGKVFRNKDKIGALISEAYEAMEKAYRVKDVDGFLDVYKVAAKKCATLADVRCSIHTFETMNETKIFTNNIFLKCLA
jgi:hypothetical protein